MITSERPTLQPIASPRPTTPNYGAIDTPNHYNPTCSQCKSFDNGLCRLRAEADWGDSSYVSAKRRACDFADLYPF